MDFWIEDEDESALKYSERIETLKSLVKDQPLLHMQPCFAKE